MILNKARSEYLSELFFENDSHDQRKAVIFLLSHSKTQPLPGHCNPEAIGDDIGNYFAQKVNDISEPLDHEEEDIAVETQDINDIVGIPVSLLYFDELSIDDVRKLLVRSQKRHVLWTLCLHHYICNAWMNCFPPSRPC